MLRFPVLECDCGEGLLEGREVEVDRDDPLSLGKVWTAGRRDKGYAGVERELLPVADQATAATGDRDDLVLVDQFPYGLRAGGRIALAVLDDEFDPVTIELSGELPLQAVKVVATIAAAVEPSKRCINLMSGTNSPSARGDVSHNLSLTLDTQSIRCQAIQIGRVRRRTNCPELHVWGRRVKVGYV